MNFIPDPRPRGCSSLDDGVNHLKDYIGHVRNDTEVKITLSRVAEGSTSYQEGVSRHCSTKKLVGEIIEKV